MYKIFLKTEQNSKLLHLKKVYTLRSNKNDISELAKLIKQRMGLK